MLSKTQRKTEKKHVKDIKIALKKKRIKWKKKFEIKKCSQGKKKKKTVSI